MDVSEFSSTAQAIIGELELAAQSSVRVRGYGYAQINEDRIGGLGSNPPLDPEEEWQPHPNRVAIDELRESGIDVRVSAGDSMRMISLAGVRLQAPKSAAG